MLRARGHMAAAAAAFLFLSSSNARADTLHSEEYPLEVHFDDPAHAAFAAEVLARVEEAWAYQVDGLGFLPPPPDEGASGSDDYDVFVTQTPYIAYCAGGAAAPSRPHGFTSKLVFDPSLPQSVLPLVTAHEFHHAIQMGIRYTGANIAESGAVYISGLQRKGEAWHLSYSVGFNAFQAEPERALDWQAEVGNYYPYGTALYLLYLEQVHGGAQDGQFVRSIWQRLGERSGPENYFEAIAEKVDFDQAFEEFSRWRYFVGPMDDGKHFIDLANWEGPDQTLDSVAVRAKHELSALPLVGVPLGENVMPYGVTYIELGLAGLAPDESLIVDLSADPAVRWTVAAMLFDAAGAAAEQTVRTDAQGVASVELEAAGHEKLVLAIANLGTTDYAPDGPTWDSFGASYSIRRVSQPPGGDGGAGGAEASSATEPEIESHPEPARDAGCACSVPAPAQTPIPLAPALLAITVLARRRRRSRGRILCA